MRWSRVEFEPWLTIHEHEICYFYIKDKTINFNQKYDWFCCRCLVRSACALLVQGFQFSRLIAMSEKNSSQFLKYFFLQLLLKSQFKEGLFSIGSIKLVKQFQFPEKGKYNSSVDFSELDSQKLNVEISNHISKFLHVCANFFWNWEHFTTLC